MKRWQKLFHRLDTQLALLVGSVVALWFISFLVSAQFINQQKLEKSTYVEVERIKLKIEAESTRILNDIVLDHRKSLELALQDIYQSLNLSWIELRMGGKKTLKLGEKSKKVAGHYWLEKAYPLRFGGKEYGVLSIGKELWILNGPEAISKKWIAGIALVMIAIFFLIQLFIRKQIVSPLNLLISHFGESKPAQDLPFQSHSKEIDDVIQNFRAMREKLTESERREALGKLAAQVAHDIRSPLTALSIVNEDLSELPEGKRVLVKNAVSRIREIANDLLEKRNAALRSQSEKADAHILGQMVESLVSEKRLQFRSRLDVSIKSQFEKDSRDLFVHVHAGAFKALLSNLLNNAIEAIEQKGNVLVLVTHDLKTVTLKVIDNGKGIAPEIMAKLFEQGASFNKTGGSGLGLYSAKEKLTAWGGSITLESIVGEGTTVSISLPAIESNTKRVRLSTSQNSFKTPSLSSCQK